MASSSFARQRRRECLAADQHLADLRQCRPGWSIQQQHPGEGRRALQMGNAMPLDLRCNREALPRVRDASGIAFAFACARTSFRYGKLARTRSVGTPKSSRQAISSTPARLQRCTIPAQVDGVPKSRWVSK